MTSCGITQDPATSPEVELGTANPGANPTTSWLDAAGQGARISHCSVGDLVWRN